MKINHNISISKTLTDLYSIRQNMKMENIFEDIVSNVLLVKDLART